MPAADTQTFTVSFWSEGGTPHWEIANETGRVSGGVEGSRAIAVTQVTRFLRSLVIQ